MCGVVEGGAGLTGAEEGLGYSLLVIIATTLGWREDICSENNTIRLSTRALVQGHAAYLVGVVTDLWMCPHVVHSLR